MKKEQLSIFDFIDSHNVIDARTESEEQSVNTTDIPPAVVVKQPPSNKTVEPMLICKEDVQEMSRSFVLSEIKDIISAGVLSKSDKYFRLFLECAREPHVFQDPFDAAKFQMSATPMSDSAIFLEVYQYGVPGLNASGDLIPLKEYLDECEKKGAYTKAARNMFGKDNKATPHNIIEYFNIYEHVRNRIYATGTEDDCHRAASALIAWNIRHIGTDEEMIADDSLNFMRASRKTKKKQEDPACFDGNCLEKNIINGKIALFGREVE